MTDAWGITDGYWDVTGEWHPTSEETREVLLAAMDAAGRDEPPPPAPMWFVLAGHTPRLDDPCDVRLEDGTTLSGLGALPPDLPVGYHDLLPVRGGPPTRLVVTPRRCRMPSRAWGFAAHLYSVRSAESWGIGDLGDLARLAAWTRSLGGGALLLNPLHAASPSPRIEPSPYFASSRLWRNVLYLRIADVPGAAAVGGDLERLDVEGRALNSTEIIDRDGAYRLKMAALELLFDYFESGDTGRDEFEAWRDRQGAPLANWSAYCLLAERFGPNWNDWPGEYRHPDSPTVAALAAREARRCRFHEWCQWQLDRQLTSASSAGVQLISDLAVGFDSAGADGWAYQDLLGTGCRVGAPPDIFNPAGQDWGLPPFVPWKLRAAGYEPFIATIRASLAHFAGTRIDHVMGLFRLYWIPPDAGPQAGAYVRYPASELLDLVAVEAHRAAAFVVGEDLGTVEDEMREELRDRQMLSYRLLWFEQGRPSEVLEQALAAVTTHDLPTVAGIWTDADLTDREALGLPADPESHQTLRDRLDELVDLDHDARVDDVIVAVHEQLATAPSRLLLATVDDACASTRRPNMPGTIDEWPNWRLPLPVTLEALTTLPLARAVASALDHGVHGWPPRQPEQGHH